MSTPTGNLYLQAYNKELSKYVEIPSSVGTISFYVSPTGFVPSRTANFSGFSFSKPVKIEALEMMPINIGVNNFTGSGVFQQNIGCFNNSYFDKINFVKTGYLGGFNIGYFNVAANSINSYNYGYFNNQVDSLTSFNIGASNFNSGSDSSCIVGQDNVLRSGSFVYFIGKSNDIYSGSKVIVFGNSNILNKLKYSSIFGQGNIISGSSYLNLFSDGNTVINTLNLNNFGEDNSYNNTIDANLFGISNTLTNSTQDNIFGNSNTLNNTTENTIFGISNRCTGLQNIIFGNLNTTNGIGENIYGSNNISNQSASEDCIFGNANNLSGTDGNTLLGNDNSLNQSIIDQLYRVALTGITGAGPTLFTGITGYEMLGGYTGQIFGGSNNLIVGNNNQTSLNQFSYIFGDSNQVLNNSTSYIFGSNNYLEKSSNSYAFGESNSISGFQNYVIGNSNEVRSGDYNSIFIGINYTPTGANKTATISLASVDSKIEINPSEIRLDSVNRPKINGENIIIQSEFDTIANSLNQNGPIFSTNTFQDSYYDKLSNIIFISGFNYNSGISTSLVSPPQEFTATSALFLNKFNIFSTTSYTGDSGFNIIYGNHTNSQFSPAWLVVDNSTSGVYYKNDITPFNITPQSGWYATGFREGGLLYTGTSINFGVSLVVGSRQGYMSVNTASFGTMYLPVFY
jgi:hypothetical protein